MTIIKIHEKEIDVKDGDHIDITFTSDSCGVHVRHNGIIVRTLKRWKPDLFCSELKERE